MPCVALLATFILLIVSSHLPSFASLLSGEDSVFVLHFSLAAFFQDLEDTFSRAGVHGSPGKLCTTQMVHTVKMKRGANTKKHTAKTLENKIHKLGPC